MTNDADAGSTATGDERVLVEPATVRIGFTVLLLGWLAQMLWEAREWPTYEDWLFPVLVGVPTAVLLVIQLVSTIRRPPARDRDGADEDERASGGGRAVTRDVVELAAFVVGFTLLLYVAGFLVSLPVFLVGTIYYLTRDPVRSVTASTGALVLIYLLFVEVLNMVIWDGVLGIPAPF